MNNILLLDQSPLRLDSLALLISSFPGCLVAFKSNSMNNALNEIESGNANIFIYSTDKCDDNVLNFLVQFQYFKNSIGLILITNAVSKWIVKNMKQKGISGYVLMSGKSTCLSDAIEMVSEGKRFCSPGVSSVIMDYFVDSHAPELTTREYDVLKLLANDLVSKEIATQLSISISTVESHRKMLIRKFETRSTVGLVHRAFEFGLL
jgi:DNA-binding NarL/FixJ family response regulator